MSAREGEGPPRGRDPTGDPANRPTSTPGTGARDRKGRGRSVLWIVVVALVAFLAGAGWQYLEVRDARDARDRAERELVYQRLGNVLGAAAVQAGQGNHEPARQLASRFYSGLNEHLRTAPGALGATDGGELDAILRDRDDMITVLSRGNPDSENLLAGTFVRFHRAAGFVDPGPQPPVVLEPGPTDDRDEAPRDEDRVP